jgi:hypothetical protein
MALDRNLVASSSWKRADCETAIYYDMHPITQTLVSEVEVARISRTLPSVGPLRPVSRHVEKLLRFSTPSTPAAAFKNSGYWYLYRNEKYPSEDMSKMRLHGKKRQGSSATQLAAII